jgi:elongation factor P--beta-lysine ligase
MGLKHPQKQREEIAGAQRLQTPAGRNCWRATAPNFSRKKLLARNGSKLQREEIAGTQRLQTTAGRNCWRATAPNYSGKKLLARNGSKLQQEEIVARQRDNYKNKN